MDKAAQLVAVLVFLVFGFLFGNIFLYSYAQKKYNPPEGRKPKKKIGAKKKKMLALKSGMRRPE
ncbi:unnamed protein product [Bathycoccus prasinos]